MTMPAIDAHEQQLATLEQLLCAAHENGCTLAWHVAHDSATVLTDDVEKARALGSALRERKLASLAFVYLRAQAEACAALIRFSTTLEGAPPPCKP